jgi:drug/metabolite transporter (DMT)-like permease
VVGAIATSAIGPFVWVTPDNWLDWLLFVSMGLFGGLGHLFVVMSMRWAQASLVAPFSYGQLVGATALGYLIFAQFPDLMSWCGIAIIVACGIYITYRESVRRPKPAVER